MYPDENFYPRLFYKNKAAQRNKRYTASIFIIYAILFIVDNINPC